LIDGGISKTYQRHLKPEIEKLIAKGQGVDLLIVTHIDDDHIGGIKEMYQETNLNRSFIKKVWFNSGNLLSDFFQESRKKEREVGIIPDNQVIMSIPQGITLENALIKEGNWVQNLIKVSQCQECIVGSKITILSPTEKQLKKLHQSWEIEVDKRIQMSALDHDDFIFPISELVNRTFNEDTKMPNGSSIAFLLEVEGKRVLMLGDAFPSVVAKSLKDLGFHEDNKLKIDIVKVSHHASKGNTSPELLSLIECDKFVISTDGSKHGLPDKLAIARIIANNPNCKIYFNYEEITQSMFLPEDKEQYKFECQFLSELNYEITI
jgi:beta-lactamase superfamily II metal-dependent hydrolase